MIGSEVFGVVFNDENAARHVGAIRRASAHCAATNKALILEFTSQALDMSAMRQVLADLMIENTRPPAVSVVVCSANLPGLRAIGLHLAMQGVILGVSVSRDAAELHASRERLLVLGERAASSSASKVCSV